MLELLYLFIPGYLANSLPPIVAKIFKKFSFPVDFNLKWNKKRLLGKNKTWRGVITGSLIGGLFFLLQKYSLPYFNIFYEQFPWWYGFLLAFGAIFIGDCGESLIKRRIGIKPNKSFIPWDQIDYTLGAFLVTWWIYWPGIFIFLLLLIINGSGSLLAHVIGFYLGINKEKI